jgi:hypothetical protein
MPSFERPLESRVRAIRTHGLIGGLTHLWPALRARDSRIYQ